MKLGSTNLLKTQCIGLVDHYKHAKKVLDSPIHKCYSNIMEAHMKLAKTIIFGFTLGFISYLSLSGDNGVNLNDDLLNDKQLDILMSIEIPKD